MHEKKAKGDVAVGFVIARLVELGWNVRVPLSEHAPYDLAEKDGDAHHPGSPRYPARARHPGEAFQLVGRPQRQPPASAARRAVLRPRDLLPLRGSFSSKTRTSATTASKSAFGCTPPRITSGAACAWPKRSGCCKR